MNSSTGYSEKARNVQKNHYHHLKEFHKQQRAVIHNKTRKFSIENSRRRRALELKKKIEAQKEAKRRQEALEERRRRQHEATIKYQRQNRSVSERSRTPGLEEALNAVQLSTVPNYRTKYHHSKQQSPVNTVHVYSPWKPNFAPTLYNSASYRAQHEELQSTSAHNLQQSRSLFEQHLQEQQRQLAIQQQKSLQDFNQAVLTESRLDNHEEDIGDSLCSIDSLDGTSTQETVSRTSDSSVPSSAVNTNTISSTISTPNSQSTSITQTPPNSHITLNNQKAASNNSPITTNASSKVIQAQHNSVAGTSTGNTLESSLAQTGETKLFVPKSDTSTTSLNTDHRNDHFATEDRNRSRPDGKETADLYIEETNETDIVDDKIDLQTSYTTQPAMPITTNQSSSTRFYPAYGNPGASTYANTHLIGGRTTRPYSARTPATGVTITPAAYNWNEYNPARSGTSVGSHNQTDPLGTNSHLTNHNDTYNVSSNTYQNTNFTAVPRTSNNHSPSQGTNTHPLNTRQSHGNFHFEVSSATQNSSGGDRTYEKYKSANEFSQNETYKEQKKALHFIDEAEEDDTGEDSTQDRPPITQPKGILKKTSKSKYMYGGQFRSAYIQSNSLEGVPLRDSIDIAKMKQPDPFEETVKKKSVRWTDWEKHSKLTQQLGTPRVNNDGTGKRRPYSATTLSISKVPASVKAPRSASAGTVRKAPTAKTRPGLKPQPVVASRKIIASQSSNSNTSTSTSNGNTQAVYASKNKNQMTTEPVDEESLRTDGEKPRSYMYNGPGLDKTPTDDEINWLWDKVRTCLNAKDNEKETLQRRPLDTQPTRQTATVQKQIIDGRQFVTQLRPTAITANNTFDNANSVIRDGNSLRKVQRPNASQSGNSYIRLLQLRKQHAKRVNNLQRYGGDTQQQTEYETIQPYAATDPAVSDSLQMFQAAEKLAQQSDLTESDIAAALHRQQQASSTAGQTYSRKAPSALSLEEQRILQSLDRLNERLRIVTDTNLQGSSMATKPTQYTMRMHSSRNEHGSITMAAPSGIDRQQPINKNIRRVNYKQ
ncbi:centrosomal protein of 126 kDa-like isoform X2 [Ptychodera flava]|uniref:centrosomal protein of 126 kDa-like isoform X2 n=1 Tax=Ptychodera flava TaxID=63121 RepID=UPI00396A82CA